MLALYASAYISECSRKSNMIKEYIYDGGWGGGVFLMLLLIAEWNFTKKKLQTFSNKSSKIDYQ